MVMKVTVDSRAPAEAGADLLAVAITALPKRNARVPSHLGPVDRATGGQVEAVMGSGVG